MYVENKSNMSKLKTKSCWTIRSKLNSKKKVSLFYKSNENRKKYRMHLIFRATILNRMKLTWFLTFELSKNIRFVYILMILTISTYIFDMLFY